MAKRPPSCGRPKKQYSQAERLLRVLRVLPSREWTVDELAREFGTSTRHVYRDLAQIRKSGYPLETHRAEDGRTYYRIPWNGKGVPPLLLTPDELMSLYFAKRHLEYLKGTPFADDLDTIFNRIKAEQPDRTRNHLERIVQTIFPLARPIRSYASKKKVIETIRKALLLQRRIVLHHEVPGSEGPASHTVEPYCLVLYQNGLYLIGHSQRAKALRTFAVERIHEARLTTEPFEIPSNFSGTKLDRQTFGILAGPPIKARIHFSRDVAYLLKERQYHPTQTLTAQQDGSVILMFEAGGLDEIVSWVLSWGKDATVLAPLTLVKAVTTQLTDARRQYTSSSR